MKRSHSTYLKLGALFGLISASSYLFIRFISLNFAASGSIEKILAVILFLAELQIIIHSIGFIVYILKRAGGTTLRKRKNAHIDWDNPPHVAIIVAARHEPKEVLEQTFTALHGLNYKNKSIYLLDDSSLDNFKKDAESIAKKYRAKVFRRSKRHGAKAGIINDFLSTSKEEYIAIFDADQNPMPNFLVKTVPIIHGDSLLAFVQTPQVYTNLDVSPIARASAMQQSIFYEAMCEGKERGEAMFCCGTNVIFRREALLNIGGFDEESITEDFSTSIKLQMNGYKSCYYNHATAFGMAPESLEEYFKQQARWAAGDASVFRKILSYWIFHPVKTFRSLTLYQWWEYFLSSTFYFIGWSFVTLMIIPIIYLVFGIPSFFLSPQVYFTFFIPYFILTTTVFYATLLGRHYTLKDLYSGVILSVLAAPIYIKATFVGFFGHKPKFQITKKGSSERLGWYALWPYWILIILHITGIIFGLSKVPHNPYATSVNIFWVSYHLFILLHIFGLNSKPNYFNPWYQSTKEGTNAK